MASKTLCLPSEADAEEIGLALQRAHEAVERLTWRGRTLDEFAGTEPEAELPIVTAEHIAAVAAVRSDLRGRLYEFEHLAHELDKQLGLLCGFRAEQRHRGGDHA